MEPFSRVFRPKSATERKVDQELHVDPPTLNHEGAGLPLEESGARKKSRLATSEKEEKLVVETRGPVIIRLLVGLFVFNLLVGLFLRIILPEHNLKLVGDVMIMIGVLGVLLVYFKQAGAFVFRSGSDRLPLGLNKDSWPKGFDAQGRSPFDRVRADE